MTSSVEQLVPLEESLFDDPFFVLVAVLMVAGLLLFVGLLVRASWVMRRVSPTTLRAGRSLEERLQELDDLHRRGVISAAEHATARQRALSTG